MEITSSEDITEFKMFAIKIENHNQKLLLAPLTYDMVEKKISKNKFLCWLKSYTNLPAGNIHVRPILFCNKNNCCAHFY